MARRAQPSQGRHATLTPEPPAPRPVEVPFWVKDTHPEHSYQLVLFESNDHGVEGIEMSRAEYIALKAHLAAMRGYTVGDFRAKIAEVMSTGIDGLNTSDLQQTTSHLETARDFYCAFPELVVYDSPELDEYIEKEAASA